MIRYADNGDDVNNLVVIRKPTDKSSIDQFGTPDKFLQDNSYLLGQQVFSGEQLEYLGSCHIPACCDV